MEYRYWLGATRLYSASRVIRDIGLKPDFADVPEDVLLRAAQRGKLTEDYCYRLLRGESVTVRARHCGSLQRGVAERVEAFYRWTVKHSPEYVDHQTIVFSETDRVAWTRDLRVRLNGRLTLVDIKCTSGTALDWPLQLGCGLSYDEDGCEHAAILQLNPAMNRDGYKYRAGWPAAKLKAWWRRAVNHWRSLQDFERLKGELE